MTDWEQRISALESEMAELKKLLSPAKTSSKTYMPLFEIAWLAFRRSPNMSKPEAFKSYQKALQFADHETILTGIRGYNAWLDKQDNHPVAHMTTWLNQRRFESFAEIGKAPNPDVCVVQKGDLAYDMWVAYRKRNGITFNPERITVPTQFPPS